uniref:Mitochondrial proton/calcium exchanger protein n=1 Tax=Graphocephala atropunctata TaxID=36148 RepID=A0A1B6M0Q3_9HEMI
MYSFLPGNNMFKSRHIIRGCCRCKLTIGLKNKEGSLVFKNYMYTTNVIAKRSSLAPLYFYNVGTLSQQHSFRSCFDSKIRLPAKVGYITSVRHLQTSNAVYFAEPNKPSSKVEETMEAIKEKAKEVIEKKPEAQVATSATASSTAVIKKSLRQRIMDEIYHYYHGFKLLFIDITVSSVLVWKVLKGGTLSRREYNLLIRTVGDMFRLVPFSIFIIVPFMELLLPVFIKLFPGMLPSTFQTANEKEDKIKQSLKVKLEMAKFLQQTLDEMAVTGKGHNSKDAKDFVEFFEKVRTEGGGLTSNEEILKFSKLFEDEITLDSLTRSQLMALCRVLELQPFGTTTLLRFQLRMKVRSLAADDVRIKKEGVDSLTQGELQQACRARGMRALGMSEERLRAQLTQWLDLSLNEKVPPSLLLLSRAFMLPETITTTEKLVATISALPDTVATKTKAVIGEREGKVDNKTKIELIKEEVAKIQEEKKEIEEEAKVEEKLDKEVIVDKAPTLTDSATVLMDKPKEEKDLSSKELGEALEDVLDTVGKDKKKMIIEKEELDDLKEEMKDYHEDVQNLKEMTKLAKETNTVEVEVKESKAAKRLSRTVNRMIFKMDAALSELEKKEMAKKESLQKVDAQSTSDEMLRVDELIEAIHKLQKVPDASRMASIAEVLGKIDVDKDGVVKVDDLLKVLEVIGRENIKLNEKQIDEVIDLLKKEEAINEEKALDKAEVKDESNNKMKEAVEKFKLNIPPLPETDVNPSSLQVSQGAKVTDEPPSSASIEQKANGPTETPPKKS